MFSRIICMLAYVYLFLFIQQTSTTFVKKIMKSLILLSEKRIRQEGLIIRTKTFKHLKEVLFCPFNAFISSNKFVDSLKCNIYPLCQPKSLVNERGLKREPLAITIVNVRGQMRHLSRVAAPTVSVASLSTWDVG